MKGCKSGKKYVFLAVAMVSVLLTGCGGGSTSASHMNTKSAISGGGNGIYEAAPEAGAMEQAAVDTAVSEGEAQAQPVTPEPVVQDNRKLIINMNLEVETDSFDTVIPSLEDKISQLGGYIQNMESWNGGSYRSEDSMRNSYITARIPKAKLEIFVDQIEGSTNVVSKSRSVEDVTLQYVDVESRKKMLVTEQETLLKLLETAESLEDIITIESRLSEVRYQIESMESTLRTYDNQVDYSTVSIRVNEVKRYTPVEEEETWDKIRTGFSENVYKIGEMLKNSGISFLVNLPYLLMVGIVLFLFYIIIRFLIKWNDRKIEKKKIAAVQPEKQPDKRDQKGEE